MPANADRLAEAVKARRHELQLSQLDVWQNGGPSNTTLTAVENGLVETLTRTTARKLDAGLQWPEGTAKRIHEGTMGSGDLLRSYVEQSDLSPEARADILAILEREAQQPEPPTPGRERGVS